MILLAGFGIVFLTVFPPNLVVADSWLTLMAGREVWQHGLPTHDALTVIGLGRTWTDQQWGAQLLAYGTEQLGGQALLSVLTGAFVIAAFVIAAIGARALGAAPRSIVLVFFPVILAAPWAWTIRAQVFALPLYTGLVWLLATEARRPSRRVYLVFPLLVVWANLHGSVTLAALLVMLLGAVELVTTRGRTWLRSLSLVVLPPLTVLATPYSPVAMARYYHLLLVDPPFGNKVTEWRWSAPGWETLIFYVLAAIAVVVCILGRRRLRFFDLAVLVLTFAGAVNAIRGIPWFALACMVLLPVAIGSRLEGSAASVRRSLNRALVIAAAAALTAVVVVDLARDSSWYERNWPTPALAAVRVGTAEPGTHVFATDRYADWLLWKLPELRGRVAYDVRFEIYEPEFFDRLVRYHSEDGPNWKSLADGYRVVVVDEQETESHTKEFLAEPRARRLYRDDKVSVILRPYQQ